MAEAHKGYLNLIRRQFPEDEQLRLAAGQVKALMEQPGWQVVMDLVAAAYDDYYRNKLLGPAAMRGPVPTQAEFARGTGFLAGLEQPQVAAEAFEQALEALRERNTSPSE